MPETLANAGPVLLCLGIAYLMLCIVAIVAVDMIFEEYMENQSGTRTETANRLIPGRDDREPEDTNERGEM